MTDTNIIGPINTGDKFIFVTEINSIKYVLDSIKVDKKLNYFWNNNYVTNSGKVNDTIPEFTVTISGNNYIFRDNININDLTVNKTNNILDATSVGNNQIAVVSNDTIWFPPTAFLSNVNYQLLFNNTKINIYNDKSLTSFSFNLISFLPITWYSNCSNTYDIVNTLSGTIINWTCNVTDPPPACTGVPILTEGFTLLTDCQLNFRYDYCNMPNLCGTDNCNGPCSQIYYDCTNKNNNFSCEFDPEKYFTETAWYKSPYFIALIVIMTLLIIGIIIVIVIFYVKKKF